MHRWQTPQGQTYRANSLSGLIWKYFWGYFSQKILHPFIKFMK